MVPAQTSRDIGELLPVLTGVLRVRQGHHFTR